MSHSRSTVRVTRTLDTPLGVASAAPAAAGILLLQAAILVDGFNPTIGGSRLPKPLATLGVGVRTFRVIRIVHDFVQKVLRQQAYLIQVQILPPGGRVRWTVRCRIIAIPSGCCKCLVIDSHAQNPSLSFNPTIDPAGPIPGSTKLPEPLLRLPKVP